MENQKALIDALYEMERCIKKCIRILEDSKNGNFDVASQEISIETKIKNFVSLIGINPKYLGYKYIQTAILFVIKNESLVYDGGIVKELYPEIAKVHDSTVAGVERCIRHAINTAWKNSMVDDYFWKNFSEKNHPTNKDFLALARAELIGK